MSAVLFCTEKLLLSFLRFIYCTIFMYEHFGFMYVYTCLIHRGQKTMTDPLGLELQMTGYGRTLREKMQRRNFEL